MSEVWFKLYLNSYFQYILMADFDEAFNGKINNNMQLNNQNSIDHFFTQRKITKHVEYVDTKDMNRKKKTVDVKLNFIAINIPFYDNVDDNNTVSIEMKVFGNTSLKYHGIHESKEGYFPSIMLKLGDDKQLFVHIVFKTGDENIVGKEYVSFIDIPIRYQVQPSISDMGSENGKEEN